MSAKNLDRQGRWRSVTVAFRVSPEEDAQIESAVRVSGCTKQDYIIKKLTDQSVVVQGNPKVYRGLKLDHFCHGRNEGCEGWIKKKRLPGAVLLAQNKSNRSVSNTLTV